MSSLNEPPITEQSLTETSSTILATDIPRSDAFALGTEYIAGHGHAFKESTVVSEKIPSLFLEHAFVPEDTSLRQAPIVLIYNPSRKKNKVKKKEKKEKEEDVSEKFVDHFNEHIGNKENDKKAQRLIEKMRQLGGLISSEDLQNVDIPTARLGFSILAELNHPKYKVEALDHLLELLSNDSNEKESSINLVNLALRLMKKINRELFQTEIIDVQIKITQAYSLIAELLQRHYAKKHINAITKELKIELIETIKALKSLNTQQDPRLNLYVHLALEGVRRLVDDRKELFDILERFYHLGASILAAKMDDPALSFQELAKVFKDLDPHLPNVWYNGILIINDLAKGARTDPDKLTGIQVLMREKHGIFNWKFTYAALGTLYNLTIHGATAAIRKKAFEGIKTLGPDFPGLATFANCHDLSQHIHFGPMARLKKPEKHDPNITIREECAKLLSDVVVNSPDAAIRRKAKQILIRRLRNEKNEAITEFLEIHVPKTEEEQQRWLNEERNNNVVRIHGRRSKSLSTSSSES